MVWQNGYDTGKKELQRENERLRAALDRLVAEAESSAEAIDREWGYADDLHAAIAAAKEAAPDG
jgi:hypothetical protein